MAAEANQTFEALADPTRRTILRLLATQGESAAGDIVAQVDAVSRTGVSSHLRVLRTSGLVRERKQGRYRLYSLEPGAVDDVVAFLAELYSGSLADLKAQAENATKAKPARERGSSKTA